MTDQRSGSCILCMLFPLILGLAGLYGLYWWAKQSKAEFIENDLGIKSDTLLSEKQVGGVTVSMDGRDATLTGTVKSQQRSEEVANIVASLVGIRSVDNQLELTDTQTTEEAKTEPKATLEAEPGIVEPKVIAAPEPEVTPDVTEPEVTEEPEVLTMPKKEPIAEVARAPEVTQAPTEVDAVKEMLHTLNLSGITFLFDSDEITPEGTVVLDEVASILNEHAQFDATVEGHTDSTGDDALNLDLSHRRAISVMNYLIDHGIQAERLSAIGYGESKPIASNDTPEGRATNRRIDFEVTRRQ